MLTLVVFTDVDVGGVYRCGNPVLSGPISSPSVSVISLFLHAVKMKKRRGQNQRAPGNRFMAT